MTTMSRVYAPSKYSLLVENKKNEEKVIEQKRQAIIKTINEQNPHIAIERKEALDNLNRCRDGLTNSYLKSILRLFDKFVLWPFVPRMKSSESINASGRLMLTFSLVYLGIVFAPLLLPSVRPVPIFAFVAIKFNSMGIIKALISAFLPNLLLYIFQLLRIKMCIKKSQSVIDKGIGEVQNAQTVVENELRSYNTDNIYQNNYGLTGEVKQERKPLRPETHALGGVIGVSDIFT